MEAPPILFGKMTAWWSEMTATLPLTSFLLAALGAVAFIVLAWLVLRQHPLTDPY